MHMYKEVKANKEARGHQLSDKWNITQKQNLKKIEKKKLLKKIAQKLSKTNKTIERDTFKDMV